MAKWVFIVLSIAVLTAACRHLEPREASTQCPFFDDKELKDCVFVYSLPEQSDECYAWAAALTNALAPRFKAVVAASAYQANPGDTKLDLLGRPDTHLLMTEALRELHSGLRDRKAVIDGRSYVLAPYCFAAQYQLRGRKISLTAVSGFADPVFTDRLIGFAMDSLPEAETGTYLLMNGDAMIVEQGVVRAVGNDCRLVPTSISRDAAVTPEQQADELKVAAVAAAYLPSGPDDLRFVSHVAAGKKLLFIGEAPSHYIPEVCQAAAAISFHARKELGSTVLAMESEYSLWPYLEARSLGNETTLSDEGAEPARSALERMLGHVVAYNQTGTQNKKLVLTAIDIDHAFNQTKPHAVRYLSYLASKSTSTQTRSELLKIIPALLQLKERPELEAYIDDLESRFRGAWSTFSPQDQDEIAFSLSLDRASVRWWFRQEGVPKEINEIRGEYFRKTIARAFAKAQASGGSLICYVGGEHANLSDFGPVDFPVGRTTEARYFNLEYPATKGRVGSILVEQVQKPSVGSLERVALTLMGDNDRAFIDLRAKSWAGVKHRPAEFFTAAKPKYDGVLFIK